MHPNPARPLQCGRVVQLSAFNVLVDRFPAPGETLVYNTFSGGSVVVASDWLARAQAAGGVVDPADCDPALADPDLGILVESRAAEEREFHAWLRRVKEEAGTVSALISTSYACNLACTYCLQDDVLNGRTMSPETADATVRFLAGRVEALRPRALEVTFIGGEPLLHPHLILRMARGLREACAAAGTRFGFQLITNGVLMTPEVVRSLVEVGLDGVQVTIDGDECTHGITRPDKRGRNTFAETWANVLACIDLVKISLQGNYTDENLHGFVPLLARMVKDGVRPDRVPRIKFKPALAGLGTPLDAGVDSCTWSNAKPEVQLALGDAVRAFGYTPHDHLDLGPCAVHQQNHWSIGPEGLIWKCPGFVGRPEWSTGSVQTGLTDKHRRLTVLASTRECGGCTWRPACAGGCLATQWIAAGVPEGTNCERTYFDSVGVEILKRNYFLDTLEATEAATAVASLPGRVELPREPRLNAASPRAAEPPLVQLRSPKRAPVSEMRS